MFGRIVVWLLLTVLLLGVVEAQQPRLYRVGFLFAQRNPSNPTLQGLRDGLKRAGYIEGENLALYLGVAKNLDQVRSFAKQFRHNQFDAIVAEGATDTAIAKQEAPSTPIVFIAATDPVRTGLVKSLSHPGGNATGVSYVSDVAMHGKQLSIFREVVPALKTVAAIHGDQKEDPLTPKILGVIRKVSAHLKLELTEHPVDSLALAERILSSVLQDARSGGKVGVFPICSVLFRGLKALGKIAKQNRVPLFGCSARDVAEDELLLAYTPDMYQIGYRGAYYVDRILKGIKPHDLPVETPRKFELAINLQTAEAIGIKIPPEVLQRADKVIR